MSCFITYSGINFDIINIQAQNIKIDDIAHALSLLCRGNGHYRYFYSVAQHSINCYKEAKNRNLNFKLQLASLMHDSAEAYLSDIISDIKKICPDYSFFEKRLLDSIFEKFNLNLSNMEWALVQDIDQYILKCEFQRIQHINIDDSPNKITNKLNFYRIPCKKVEKNFIKIFYMLQTAIRSTQSK